MGFTHSCGEETSKFSQFALRILKRLVSISVVVSDIVFNTTEYRQWLVIACQLLSYIFNPITNIVSFHDTSDIYIYIYMYVVRSFSRSSAPTNQVVVSRGNIHTCLQLT